MKYTDHIIRGLATLTIAAGMNFTTHAKASDFVSDYSISIVGLSVGKLGLKTELNNGNYALSGSLKAAGVGSLFSSGSGKVSVSGNFSAGKLAPSAYMMRYIEGKTQTTTDMRFSGGAVVDFSKSPKTKKKGKWVEYKTSHGQNADDPFSAMFVSASSLRSVCNNTLKIFDGAMRSDYAMAYMRTIPFSTKGYKGDAVTCRAKFKPISGYDQNKKEVQWMRDKGYADVSFAPVGNTGLYAPVVIKIKTQIGMATIRANRFEILTN